MKKHLIKISVSLLTLLLVVSFIAVPTTVAGQTTQNKAIDFMENVLSIDLSKYTVSLKVDSILDGVPLTNDVRKINNLMYALNSENSNIEVYFAVENDVIVNCFVSPMGEQVITNNKYTNQLDAVKGFLERYQAYTKIDTNNFMTMLDNVDISKDSTITRENTKLIIQNDYIWETEHTTLRWAHTINGADYNALELCVDKNGFVSSMFDTWTLYTVGDTSINISENQAIDIALESLKVYSYEMYDGLVVKDFKVTRTNIVATLVTGSVDYALRPYWDVRMMLDEVYPGNVHGIAVAIWANTGEVISYGNMAFGGTVELDNNISGDPEPTLPNYTLMAVATTVIVAIAIVTIGLMTKRKHK
jgi:hypothetical protein